MKSAHKKLIVLGAAESGVGAALLGKQQGWDVFLSDSGTIKEKYRDELNQAAIAYEEAGHTESRILRADCVVKSPGIPEKAPIMKAIRSLGIEVISEIEFGFRYKGDSKIIAITGTNGKSTTTKLVYYLLKEAGFDVSMVGNIGYSFARQLYERPTQWYVMEVSSFQLDDVERFRPNVAVLLNITPDHLDRYNYQIQHYVAAKFRIAGKQEADDHFIVNADDPVIADWISLHPLRAMNIPFSMDEQKILQNGAFVKDDTMHLRYHGEEDKLSLADFSLRGKHNQYNGMAAGITARVAGIRSARIRESFSTFEGLEHRLEFVATVRGVEFINDSKGTNLNSVWFALESMKHPTVLILGGQDKGNDYNEIMGLVREKVKAIVCLGMDNHRIHEAFDAEVEKIIDTSSAVEAVAAAYSLAERGDTVLLSPGCASFDLFQNFEDRGRQFKEAVKNL
ncbi:MAG: UDP-N-acetylmuramoyl-L-alanine--D-glutamate ligase [Bacteroidetes bacterium]|nr:UDP-N-acetylmuramoyl-L-alanine--D-glutamate ligase [Bacteroidota bacterium]